MYSIAKNNLNPIYNEFNLLIINVYLHVSQICNGWNLKMHDCDVIVQLSC